MLVLMLSVAIIGNGVAWAFSMPDPAWGPSPVGAFYVAAIGIFVGAYGLYALRTGRG